ncbi:hypothetical protein T492DRAFT_1047678 [Pavlovales sp. CCMP2436]|nr:hypothetical protein T492DRAFT_1047678 [Pavlovales sp. CCMP2436]
MVNLPKVTLTGPALLFLVGAASTVVFLAGVFRCASEGGWNREDRAGFGGNTSSGCGANTAYALCTGLFSMLVVGGFLLAALGNASCASKAAPVVGVFLMLWWTVAALVLTFDGPFVVVSNGYLGSWLSCVAAFVYALEVSPLFHRVAIEVSGEAEKVTRHMLLMVVASIIELVAAALGCGRGGCSDYWAYATAVGAVSLFLCSVLIVGPKLAAMDRLVKPICLFLALFWFVALVILTFVAPFVLASNGFWATWIACIASGLIAYDAFSGQPTASSGVVAHPANGP